MPDPDRSTPHENGEPGGGGASPPGAGSPERIPVQVDERSFIQLIPQFFIFPLVLVTIGVLVYVFFIASAQDERSTRELLSDIQKGWDQTRNRAAYELAMRAQDLELEGKTFAPDVTRALIDGLARTTDNPDMRSYLIAALGRAGDPELALPELLGILENREGASLEDKVYAIRGLGLSRSPRVVEPLLEVLDTFPSPQEWEPRLITLSALANVAGGPGVESALRERIVTRLRAHLEDPRWNVRWNVAMILATEFGDPAGVPLLRKLLRRGFIAEHVKDVSSQDPWIIGAINALAELRDSESRPMIEELGNDASMKVRNAVFLYREKLSNERATSGQARRRAARFA